MARTINLIVVSMQRLTKDEILTLVEISIDHFIARFCQSDLSARGAWLGNDAEGLYTAARQFLRRRS